jgi:hypothetical protein
LSTQAYNFDRCPALTQQDTKSDTQGGSESHADESDCNLHHVLLWFASLQVATAMARACPSSHALIPELEEDVARQRPCVRLELVHRPKVLGRAQAPARRGVDVVCVRITRLLGVVLKHERDAVDPAPKQ